MKNRDRVCVVCGAHFLGTKRAMYCSPKCKNKATNDKRRNKAGLTNRVCKICGKPFFAMDSRVKYCSEECRTEGKREACRKSAARCNQDATNRGQGGVAEVSYKICPICKSPFPSVMGTVYCSDICEKIAENRKRRAEKPKPVIKKPARTLAIDCKKCQDCIYYSRHGMSTCDYCFIEGKMRGEPVSEGCTKFRKYRKGDKMGKPAVIG